MLQMRKLFVSDLMVKDAAMTGGGMFNSGLMRGGMGVNKVRTGQQLASLKFKSFSKAFRPPKNPFAAVNPMEVQRLKDLKQNAQFGGPKIMKGIQHAMSFKNPSLAVAK
jgi:hypothetical protein